MSKSEIFKKLESIRTIPTLPRVIFTLRREIHNQHSNAANIASIIEDDPAMMAKILKVVNSAFFAGIEPVTNVKQAIARMGFSAISNIALSTTVFTAFDNNDDSPFDRKEFWRHCIATGAAASAMQNLLPAEKKHLFRDDILHLAGLLHDIGKIIFEQFFHDSFINAVQISHDEQRLLHDCEKEVMGVSHTEVGAWLGEKWNLPPELISVIKHHHDCDPAEEKHCNIVNIIYAANLLCNSSKIGNSGDYAEHDSNNDPRNATGFDAATRDELIRITETETDKSEILLSFA